VDDSVVELIDDVPVLVLDDEIEEDPFQPPPLDQPIVFIRATR
jgi:hypothetical protein